ncbi:WXG100 family type VII secretion target [Pseudonocardia thermophila]|jgi:WXG100 family type VII secretion target|uniref:WXG100 family type VII secretion target n=1 Tax=Pseudonocardia thermophila TaxID=1848 RepID=A0A1M6X447_PSETH|nr:WXG100 family type VII secretion target [Pseudonocardia thermophila]SHL00832.1 WXG100 family type VII secretion target [Pseudonocardia thermophila]
MTQPGAGLGTQTDVMARAAQHVAGVRSDIEAQLAALRSRLEALPELWQGAAGAAFVAAMARCDQDSRLLAGALGGIADQLRTSGVAYDTTEQEQHRAVVQSAEQTTTGITAALKGL